ncbi:MAG: hypothetical protein V7724_02865 [Sediminicola sp.]|tara:strand:+ start:63604 stop:65151 length:1548 start_codon:yes stop_codon:yes gene_type:complete
MKRFAKVLLTLVVLIALALVGLQYYAQHRLQRLLAEEIPPYMQLSYGNATVNILSMTVSLEMLSGKVLNRDSLPELEGSIEKLRLSGLGAWEFMVNDRIKIDKIELTTPHLTFYRDTAKTGKDTVHSSAKKPFDPISLGQLVVSNGSVNYLRADSTIVRADSIQISLQDIAVDAEILKKKIPFTYGSYHISAKRFYVDLGPYEKLDMDKIDYANGDLRLLALRLQSKYSKRELSKILPKEHDHFSLQIPEIHFQQITFGHQNDTFFLKSPMGNIKGPQLEIYRDKLVADDLTRKALYSQALRELPIDLNLEEIRISDAFIGYEELVNAQTKAGRIYFDNVHATLNNISNTYGKGQKTTIVAKSLFMGNSPLELDWTFDTNDVSDRFSVRGSFTDFRPESVNSFLESNLRARASGFVEKIYFTFGGNRITSTGDLKMKYNDFDFQILKKDRLGVNKLLTVIGKIFVNDGSKTDAEGFRNGEIKVERDPTKSFFNYLWINVRDGMVSTLTGKAERKS